MGLRPVMAPGNVPLALSYKRTYVLFMQVLKPEIREAILRCARELFFERGFEGATMRRVAEDAGLSASNLYKYFQDKDALFEAVVGGYANGFRRGLEATLAHAERDEADPRRIEGMVSGFSRAIDSDPKVFCTLMDRSIGSRYEAYKQECAELLARHFAEGLEANAAMRFLAKVLVTNLLSAVTALALEYGGSGRLEGRMESLFRYHMAGYAALKG